MQQLDDDLWLLTYPLRIFGADIIRQVTVIRLPSGKLLIHSTGPFSAEDIRSIHALGEPSWLVDAMLDHDTFSQQGHEAFPEAAFLAPAGFEDRVEFPLTPLDHPPADWVGAVDVMPIAGNPSFHEHVFLHPPSRTLIVADLIFNYRRVSNPWTKLLLYPAMGCRHAPGMSRRFRSAIEDRDAFRQSLETMFTWDFDRIIVGHGQVIEAKGKALARDLFNRFGFLS